MQQPYIPPLTKLSPSVTRILGHNPGYRTLQGTNSYLIGVPELPRVLIDTTSRGPGLETYLKYLKLELEQCHSGYPLSAIILTHWHPDHAQGVSAVLDIADQVAKRNRDAAGTGDHSPLCDPPVPVYKHPEGPDLKAIGYYDGPVTELTSDDVISVPCTTGHSSQIIVLPTPGHAVDHICLLLKEDGVPRCLFTGDLILGHGSTTVENLPVYMQSLSKLRLLIKDLFTSNHTIESHFCLMPAHSVPVNECLAKIDEYIENRCHRIQKAAEFLLSKPLNVWVSEADILDAVYPGIPEQLRLPALINLRHSLFWLSSTRPAKTVPMSGCEPIGLVGRLSNETKRVMAEHEFVELISCLDPTLNQVLHESWEWRRIKTESATTVCSV
ncbi:unnamed protein product [Calicophoron daubneyi]|uniref:Metallo-beta-lactamase domain-containing protein n=1 Tax=Calicophoron daubneyi TaxID=300641 RepID=A0AAV2THD0_CALDB